VPLTDDEIEAAVIEAAALVERALPLGAVGPGCRAEREGLRALAFTEALRELLARARVPQGWSAN
jgi:hypothetical protein